MREIWRPIPKFEELYEISSFGRVRSLIYRNGNAPIIRPRIMKPGRGRYLFVMLCDFPRRRREYVHRLVLEAFVGLCPVGYEAAHEDGKYHSNVLSNLKWKTKLENEADKVRHGTLAIGLRHGTHTKPWTRSTGERHGSKTKPWTLARGKRNGTHTMPWTRVAGERNGRSRITSEQAEICRRTYATGGVTLGQLSLRYGICPSAVRNIVSGGSWKMSIKALKFVGLEL